MDAGVRATHGAVAERTQRDLIVFLVITVSQSYDTCGRNGGYGARQQGHAVNTSLYARRQLPCCRRSLFAGPTPAASVGCGSGPGLQDRLPQGEVRPGSGREAGLGQKVRPGNGRETGLGRAAVEPAGRSLRRVLQPGSGCRVSPSWLNFSDYQDCFCIDMFLCALCAFALNRVFIAGPGVFNRTASWPRFGVRTVPAPVSGTVPCRIPCSRRSPAVCRLPPPRRRGCRLRARGR